MKNHHLLARAFLLGVPLSLVLSAQAAPKPSKKLGDVGQTKIPVGGATKLLNRTPIGERYNLWLSINGTDCSDPLYPGKSNPYDDHTFECYGKLTLNGTTYWSIPKEWANNGFAGVGHLDLPAPMEVHPQWQGYRLNREWKTSGSKGKPFEPEVSDRQFQGEHRAYFAEVVRPR